MSRNFIRFVALILTFSVCFCFCITPVSAADSESETDIVNTVLDFGEFIYPHIVRLGNFFGSIFNSDICPDSFEENGRHIFIQQYTQVDSTYGSFYICEYCGKSASSVWFDGYPDAVSTLEYTEVDDQGCFVFYPTGWHFDWSGFDSQILSNSCLSSGGGGFEFSGAAMCSGSGVFAKVYSAPFSLPAGLYELNLTSWHGSCSYYSSLYGSDYGLRLMGSDDGVAWTEIAFAYYGSGGVYSSKTYSPVSFSTIDHSYKQYCLYECFRNGGSSYSAGLTLSGGRSGFIKATSFPDDVPDTSSTRPAAAFQTINNYNTTNNYVDNSVVNYYIGTLDESNNVTNIYNTNIYEEDTLVFTEPVTGAQYQTTGWTYNYDTRCYNIDLESGTMTVDGTDIDNIVLTYGDESMAIWYRSGTDAIAIDHYYYVAVASEDCTLYGHTYTYETVTEPTCSSTGERQYTCTVCGDQYAEDVPALEHIYNVEQAQAPSCTAAGENMYTCTLCGDQYTEVVPSTEHVYTYTEVKPPTCYSEGTAMYTCGTCGMQYAESISQLDHVGEIVERVDPVYDEDGNIVTYGYTVYQCSLCGDQYTVSDAPEVEKEGWFAWLGEQLRSLLSSIINGLGEGLEYLFGTAIKSVTDLSLDLVQWVFELLDVDILDSWYDWLDDDNPYFNDEFGTEVTDIWASS